ncbi:putative disease resistance protein RGA3 [Triticum urartu]|uniref:AAA+ ATPase domain-containing protein n=2 Tax=Triticum urartu TaxID=4572 RepID=A0A8R7TBE1_TRIUA|nr:putative disease resistance protein RGA3 [Triticum urartu]XP_048553965.1 putative disease resistance protein RGA3 [Triticum urartu]XP_048553966.1 putative disease resistance protein RGA3 [Triticum urartu]XP_048553967.1 putative disease resistance protein RGA3 [Triticum urartu]XP_048553968.1 putative disease resistance protein RGA3 [Triticum urartu]
MGMYAELRVAQWVVGKALAPVADGVLGAWAATKNFGPNVEALSTELLLVKATLEQAAHKELGGPAMEMLLQKLRESGQIAEDLLDELDYFRIHDELHGTYEAADEHGKGCVRNLALNARHTVKAVGKLVNCCAWQHATHRQRSRNNPSSSSNVNQEVSGCMPKFGKLLPLSSSPHPHVGDDDRGNEQETPKLEFNRVDFSRRMKGIVEKLQFMRNEINKILIHCEPRPVLDITQSRPITKGRIDEPKLYGRDHVMNSIIHDIIEGQYCDKSVTVIPVVGPGGMGKTTLIQHIYRSQQVQNHFPVMIWICVSLSFNLDKVLDQIKTCTPAVVKEKVGSTTEDLIEQRLKSKRFLLVLDDIWQISNGDDWGKLLSTLNKSEKKGSMILVTTRFQAIAQKVETSGHSIKLNGLESKEFRKLFLAFVFGDEQYPRDKHFLLETGDKIMEKLKGSPLAAKSVGRLLSKDLSLRHWKRVLESKEWEKQTADNEIMPALKLSYDFLPFHLQQCFSYSGLFPEDYHFGSHELIGLWVGLDILIPSGQNQTFEDIGLSNLSDLVVHGFFREEGTDGDLWYVMHDLLHDLALNVASHDCLSLRLSDVGSMEIRSSICHLSISTYDFGEYAVSCENLKSEMEGLKTRFKVEHLQTLMLFGEMDEGFVNIFSDFFGEVNTLCVLHFPNMLCPVESMLHNFSGLLHLRYLCLGTDESQMHLPLIISKFYHLRILDLRLWDGRRDLPEDMSNLAKLCHFYVPSDDQLHSDIYNVGKLKLLEELKVFQVNKKSEGFEAKQLEHLTKLRELGMYNLEKLDTTEEAAQAKLMEKKYLRSLTLDWDSKRSSVEPGAEAAVLERLQPHEDLQVLCIRGHGGSSCPTWLGDELAVEALQSLWLDGVSWEVFPSLGKAWDLRKLRLENISGLKEVIMEKSFCMLVKLELIGLGSFEKWVYPAELEASLDGEQLPADTHMFPFLQVLMIEDCPKFLEFPISNHILYPNWFPKLQKLQIHDCPEFSSVIHISWIESLRHVRIRQVKVLKEFTYSKSSDGAELEIVGEGYLHRLDQVLVFDKEIGYPKQSLQRLSIRNSRAFLSSFSRHSFPSSLQFLELVGVEDLGTLEPLSNLYFVTELTVCWCGEDLKCQGLQSLLTTGGHLRELKVLGSPGFFADWDPNPRRALENVEVGEEQHTQLVSSTLRKLYTDDAAGLLSAPICSFLSSSLTKLELSGHVTEGMEHFSKEQEDALQLLSSLEELAFLCLPVLQQLPVGLHNLTNLKVLSISECLEVSSLPKDGLPKSLQELHVAHLCSRELIQQCMGLVGTIPTIRTYY